MGQEDFDLGCGPPEQKNARTPFGLRHDRA
jgi:hypothetical protein